MEYTIELQDIPWDRLDAWSDYCKYAKRHCRYLQFPEQGTVIFKDDKMRYTMYDATVIVKGGVSDFLDQYFPIEVQDAPNPEVHILPLETKVYSSTYLFSSTRLAILQADEKARPVLDKYLIDLFCCYNPEYDTFYFMEEDYEKLLRYERVNYADIGYGVELLDWIRQRISDDAYVNIHLDEYYIPEKEWYEKRHFVHETLIYGYDDVKKVFHAYGFGKREQMLCFEIGYEDLIRAFEKGRLFYFSGAEYLEKPECFPITAMTVCVQEEFELDWRFMKEKLWWYLHPLKNDVRDGVEYVHGIDVHIAIWEELEGTRKTDTVDYRTFHLLWEHKRNLCRLLTKILPMEDYSYGINDIMAGYRELESKYEQIRWTYLRKSDQNDLLDSMSHVVTDKTWKKRMALKMREMFDLERKVLYRHILADYHANLM